MAEQSRRSAKARPSGIELSFATVDLPPARGMARAPDFASGALSSLVCQHELLQQLLEPFN